MWSVFKLLCLLTAFNHAQAYIEDDYRQKSSFINYQLQKFRSQTTTTQRPKTNRFVPNHRYHPKAPATESPIRPFEGHKFRHTRFPKMDGLLTKISRIESDRDKKFAPRWATERPLRTVKTTTVASDDFENYDDDFEDDDDRKVDDSDWEDEEDDDDDEEDDSTNEESGWQAEEATKAPETLTEFKWRHYGTRSRVEESMRNHKALQVESSKVSLAAEHARRMNREAGCRVPRARVVPVQAVHPDPGKTYMPHCTLLHRCGEDAGCCRSELLSCAPKHTARVDLYFYAKSVGRQDYVVEKLSFVNHTECECVEKSTLMSGDRPHAAHLRSGVNLRTAPQAPQATQAAPEAIRRCRCPELYTAKPSYDENCNCDCSDGDRECLRKKRGKEHFSLKDRLCIQNGQCGYPSCDFGAYMRHSGRCPRKQEKFEAFARMAPK